MNDKVYVDTSAFYALMDRADSHHEQAVKCWKAFLDLDTPLFTSNYVVIETMALLQNRLGLEAATLWHDDILDIISVHWVDVQMHRLAYELWLSLKQRKLSLVDCIGFVIMRNKKCREAFCFDRHFKAQGFVQARR